MENTPETNKRLTMRGEPTLALGFLLLLVSFSLFPSVMVYFLALLTLPPALFLLALGAGAARDLGAPTFRQAGGFWLLLLGLVALGFAALTGTHLSYLLAESGRVSAPGTPTNLPGPGLRDFAWFAARCVLPVLLMAPGLRWWTGWSFRRCLGWSIGIFVFPILAFVLHHLLATVGLLPLSA